MTTSPLLSQFHNQNHHHHTLIIVTIINTVSCTSTIAITRIIITTITTIAATNLDFIPAQSMKKTTFGAARVSGLTLLTMWPKLSYLSPLSFSRLPCQLQIISSVISVERGRREIKLNNQRKELCKHSSGIHKWIKVITIISTVSSEWGSVIVLGKERICRNFPIHFYSVFMLENLKRDWKLFHLLVFCSKIWYLLSLTICTLYIHDGSMIEQSELLFTYAYSMLRISFAIKCPVRGKMEAGLSLFVCLIVYGLDWAVFRAYS